MGVRRGRGAGGRDGHAQALSEGDTADIEDKLRRQAKKIWGGNPGQADPAQSGEKLRQAVKKWQVAGIDTANLTGFKTRGEYGAAVAMPPVTGSASFGWRAEELDDLGALADILCCMGETAGNVLLTLVRHVADGPKPVAPAFLKDLLRGLPLLMGRRNKQSDLLGFIQDHGYWYKHANHSQAAHRPATYGLGLPGQELRDRLSPRTHEHTH